MKNDSLQHIAVFCGSQPGQNPAFAAAAQTLGTALGRSGRGLVYGGSRLGLMGLLADATLAAGGRVVGVVPRALVDREVAHDGLSELIVVGTMHERKAAMAARADAFIAMAGGIGTLDEFTEVFTWAQLGLHDKPLGLLDTGGFYQPLLAFFDQLTADGFLHARHRDLLVVAPTPEALLANLAAARPAPPPKYPAPTG
jgi:uncharacterized protein (TIGR00730 family)